MSERTWFWFWGTWLALWLGNLGFIIAIACIYGR